MNLAKALLSSTGKLSAGRIHHGLTLPPPAGHGLTEWRAVTQDDGVFTRLYEHWMGVPLRRGTILDVADLLGYCWPIGLQYAESGYGATRLFYGFSAGVFDQISAWTVAAVPAAADITHHPTLGPSWSAVYHEIPPAKDFAMEVFGLHAVASEPLQFFEQTATSPFDNSRPLPAAALMDPLRLALPGAVEPVSRDDKSQFVLSLPMRISDCTYIPMNDLLATHAAMFCLSSLVRYWPEQLDYAAESKDGWLVESFVKSTPIHFLRLKLSPLLGRTIVLKPST